jgi:Family of unknown function (DUF6370)
MKKVLATILIASALAQPALLFADQVKTIKGDGLCAKCELGETKKCQNVIRVTNGGKTTLYYLEDNKVSKDFHKQICQSVEKVMAKGTVKEENGKNILVATEIKKVK